MKIRNLHRKRATFIVLLILLLSAVGMTKAMAQTTYTYTPPLQTYTDCGSGTCSMPALSYSGCYLSGGYDTYRKDQAHAALWSRNSSSGTLTFRVEKCSGYFQNGNSGKVLILDQYYGDVYCSSFSISGSYTSYVTATISNYGDFTGSRTFQVYLITSNQQNKFYAGDITIQASNKPVSHCYEPTDVTSSSATLQGCVNPNGEQTTYRFRYGKTTNYGSTTPVQTLPAGSSCVSVSADIYGLDPETTYYYTIVAANSAGSNNATNFVSFTTLSEGSAPTVTTLNANSVTSNSATLRGTVNPQGRYTHYYFKYGTSSNNYTQQTVEGTLAGDYDDHTVSVNVTGLSPNTTYYFRCYAYNDKGEDNGTQKTFVTNEENCFYDCTSSSCGQYGQQMYTAAQYLCEHGIVEGINGYLNPDVNVTRAQLAKVALFGLYNGENNVPNPLVTDYFPSIYPDLQDNTTYYYRAAKALLYLEYRDANDNTQLDGISPFDRDRSTFNPSGTIERCFVLKVLMETFNIKPATGGTNPFSDFDSSQSFWGYAKKAYDLNIVQTTELRPYDPCTRGEAFLYLYRILTNSNITKPTPVNSESPASSDFFIPANLSPEVVNSMRGVEYGNFNYYEKDFFDIPGYMNLGFGIAYNSYLTEMPEDFYPVKPLGKAWTHTYDMYMNIITDSYNNRTYYVFHMKDGALLIYTLINGTMTSLTQGNYYELTQSGTNKYILKSTSQVHYTFERQSTSDGIYYLTQIKDRNNNAINISYAYGNSHYRITSVTTLGRTLNFYYTSGTDLLSSVKDPINREVYFYYTNGELTSLKDAKNQTSSFLYGTLDFEKGLLKEITLPRGNKVYNNYQQRKLTSTKYNNDIPTTVSIVQSYQNGNTNSTVTQPVQGSQSITTNYTMNADNRITRVQDSNNKDISFSYNNSSHESLISQMIDNKSNIQTSFSYSSKGKMTSASTSAGGQTISFTIQYNSNNDISYFTDANNNTTHYYYTNGNLSSIEDALGNTTAYVNNSHGAPTQVTNPMGVTTTYEYNDYGNVTNVAIPSMNLSGSITYDGVSRIISKTDMAGNQTSFTYDANDNLLTATDAMNHVTTYEFDANDNLVQITNALGYSTLMTYDNNDFLTALSFQNATKNFAYNTDGSMKTYTDPNGHVFNYTYNDSGNLLGDGYATYTYNNKGQLVSVTKDNKPIQYTYDALSRVTSVAYDGNTVSYAYDNNGNILSITYPGNKTVTYTYDALNRMTSVKDWNNATTTYSYRSDGQLSYYQYPNNVRTTYGYDNSGRRISQTTRRNNGSGTNIASYNFTLNNLGSHTQESISEPFESYPAMPSVSLSYSYNNANRLLSAGDLSFSYDSNGNTTSRTGRNYTYDIRNNLSGVSGDFTASYSYDGYGNRRSATRNGVTKNYVLDLVSGNGNVLMETGGAGTIYYIYGASGLVSRINASNETHYYVYDYRGSTVAMTDASTSAYITHKYQYDDFGKVLQSEESDANPFQYVGQFGVMYETEGLVFMRARYYDEAVGRFLSEDPIWSVNLYPYANNNPICNIDPSGKVFSEVLGVGFEICNVVSAGATTFTEAFFPTTIELLNNMALETEMAQLEVWMDGALSTLPSSTTVTSTVASTTTTTVTSTASTVATTAGSKAAVIGIGGSVGATIVVGAAGAAIATGSCIWAHRLGAKGKKGAAYGVGIGGGALGGAMLGAAIGSVIPGVGTVVGAVVGGIIGGVAGYFSARSGVKKYKKAEAERNYYTL